MERLDHYFKKLTAPSFARYGFAYGDLIARWGDIVGEEFLLICQPEQIKWPRTASAAKPQGGVLILRVETSRMLDVQYRASTIIERVNQFYGFGAVLQLKIKPSQGLSRRKHLKSPPSLSAERQGHLSHQLREIDDEALRQALQRLGVGLLAREVSSPQNSPQGKL